MLLLKSLPQRPKSAVVLPPEKVKIEGSGKELEEDPGKENNVRHLLLFG